VSRPGHFGKLRKQEALAAIEAGRVIALPTGDGYGLVAALSRPDALTRLPTGPPDPDRATHAYVMVGLNSQAIDLASHWSRETALLTDRMWPGPLVVIVPARQDDPRLGEPVVWITLPASRDLRALCRAAGPLVVRPLRGPDGLPVVDPYGVGDRIDVALIVDGGVCRGPGSTVVDCTVSPPAVRQVGALPESFVDAALMMSARRRRWFSKRPDPGAPAR
jgi:L-threonylcarbamoyladenylate synthase